MKILHVTNAVGWSGGMEQIVLLLTELQKEGHESILVCPPGSELIAQITPLSISIVPIPMFQDYDLIAAVRLRRLIAQIHPDIVHAHHPTAHALSLLALSGTQKPGFIVSRRVSFSLRKNPFSRWKYRSNRIHSYSVVSQSVRQTLIQGGVSPDKIEVIYSAFHPRFVPKNPNQNLKLELKIPPQMKVVTKVANVSYWKGQTVFLQSAQKILKKTSNILFLLIGKDTDSLLPNIQSYGISKNVRTLGFRKDIVDLLSITDLSINSAIEGEGLSGALRESLAMSIPVIASNVSGNREIVQDGVTGFLVPPNNPDALADSILKALDNETSARSMAQKGQTWVLQNCSVPTMTERFIHLYSRYSE